MTAEEVPVFKQNWFIGSVAGGIALLIISATTTVAVIIQRRKSILKKALLQRRRINYASGHPGKPDSFCGVRLSRQLVSIRMISISSPLQQLSHPSTPVFMRAIDFDPFPVGAYRGVSNRNLSGIRPLNFPDDDLITTGFYNGGEVILSLFL